MELASQLTTRLLHLNWQSLMCRPALISTLSPTTKRWALEFPPYITHNYCVLDFARIVVGLFVLDHQPVLSTMSAECIAVSWCLLVSNEASFAECISGNQDVKCCVWVKVMDLWKRVNPGVMEKYVEMPASTMTDHFQWLDPTQQEPLNRTHHFKKTDFSEYNEVAARSMKALITNKVSP